MAATATLVDNFSGSIDTGKWGSFATGSSTIAQTGGQVVATPPSSTATVSYAGYYSVVSTYSLTGSYVHIEIAQAVNTASGVQQYLSVIKDSSNKLVWLLENGTLKPQKTVAGVTSDVTAGVTFNSTTHRWWRIREASGTSYFDFSSDGLTWTNHTSLANPFAITSVQMEFGAGTYSSVASPGVAKFDNFNVTTQNGTASLTAGSSVTAGYSSANIKGTASLAGAGSVVAGGYSTQSGSATMQGSSEVSATGRAIIPTEAIDQKTFQYKIYDSSGTYLGDWNDVINDFRYSQEVNSLGSSTDIYLARTAQVSVVSDDPLATEASADITTEAGVGIVSFGTTNQPFGPGTTVNLNYRVDVYLFFGYPDLLETQTAGWIEDQTGEPIDITVGSPNGRRIFSGFISSYTARYGNDNTTKVTLTSYGDQLGNYLIEDSGNVTVPYYSQDPADILRAILDKANIQGLIPYYDSRSITNTSTVATYTFRLNTYYDGVKKVLEMSPSDWYWFYDSGENKVWLRGRPATPDHTFVLGKHIQSIEVLRDTSTITNTVYFTGGELSPSVNLFSKYQDATSVTSYGQQLKIMSDQRVTLQDTADIIGQGEVDRNENPSYIASCVVPANVYQIEDIKLGELVTFRNFDNYIDSLELQIVRIDYTIDAVTLQMGSLLPAVSKRIADIKRNLEDTQAETATGVPT